MSINIWKKPNYISEYDKPSLWELYVISRENTDYYYGKTKGYLADKSEFDTRDAIEIKIYDKLHGEIEMDYMSIANYLDKNNDVVNEIIDAFVYNLMAQGKSREEISETVNDMNEPWKVYYIYSLLTQSSPDYTVDLNVTRDIVETAINTSKRL